MNDLELDERRYSALRIAEFLESNYLMYSGNNEDVPLN